MYLYKMDLYGVALQFSFRGTQRHSPNPLQNDNAHAHNARFIKTCFSKVELEAACTEPWPHTLLKNMGMNWNADCSPGIVAWHQSPDRTNALTAGWSKPHILIRKSSRKPFQKSGGYNNSRSGLNLKKNVHNAHMTYGQMVFFFFAKPCFLNPA